MVRRSLFGGVCRGESLRESPYSPGSTGPEHAGRWRQQSAATWEGHRATRSQGRRVAVSQSHRVTESQGRRVTESQSHRVTESQSHRVTGSQGRRTINAASLRLGPAWGEATTPLDRADTGSGGLPCHGVRTTQVTGDHSFINAAPPREGNPASEGFLDAGAERHGVPTPPRASPRPGVHPGLTSPDS